MNKQQNYTINDLLFLMSRLREPGYGCPWDLEQSYASIAASTLEEAYEVVDAIEQGDPEQLKEELGDLLFQVVFYSQLGTEENVFTFEDITSAITAKLLRRHPHVFPDGTLDSRIDANTDKNLEQQQIKAKWEQIKNEERSQKGHHSVMDDVPLALPAATRAAKLQKRAASINFDWPSYQGSIDKLHEEIEELQSAISSNNQSEVEDELGDVLFTVINLSRHLKVDPETALRRANRKFEQRFRHVESIAKQNSKDIKEQSLDVLEAWWQRAKQEITEKS